MEKNNSKSAIIIFAKTIESGKAKSRIAAIKGEKTAAEIYIQLLKETATLVKGMHYYVAYTGSKSPNSLKILFYESKSFFMQKGKTLGNRIHQAFTHLFCKGYTYICAIGTDCPMMSKTEINTAFTILKEGVDTVIGPAHDGGYYLVACNKKSLSIFSAKKWSTAELLTETLEIAKSNGITYRCLTMLSDIDYWEDYISWQGVRKK